MVAVDLRGWGESSFGEEEDFSASMLVEDIRHTLRDEGIPSPFILIGHRYAGEPCLPSFALWELIP